MSQPVRRERRDIKTSRSKLIVAEAKNGDSESSPGALNNPPTTYVVTAPGDSASFVNHISCVARRMPEVRIHSSTVSIDLDSMTVAKGWKKIRRSDCRLAVEHPFQPMKTHHVLLGDGLTGDQGESAGLRSRSGTDAFQGRDSSMLNRKPTTRAAETVQRVADTETAAVKHEKETLVEPANASRFDEGHGCEYYSCPNKFERFRGFFLNN